MAENLLINKILKISSTGKTKKPVIIVRCKNCGGNDWRKKGYRFLKNTMGSYTKKVRRFQCKKCGYKIYYRRGLYNKIRLKHNVKVLKSFKKAVNSIDKNLHCKPSIRNIQKEMGLYGKLVTISTIGRWLKRFYPERIIWHYMVLK